MDKFIGKRLDGRYEITELIGVGGMANVYKATDLLENTVVAVKILRDEFVTNEDFVRRFKNESKAISLLNNPNIVKVFDVSVTDKAQYIVMEFVDGITLKEYIEQRKKLSWKETIKFTTELLDALDHAHRKGIIHRDIKPQNIMLLPNGDIKVMDFGIARFSRSERRTVTDKAIGSVHYVSPEQAQGEQTDARSDIYSTGIMMYEMLTGTLPFDADSPVGVAIKQISATPKPPCEVNPEIPEGLEEIVLKAMEKTPEDRYQTAAEMLQDIEKFKENPSALFAYKYMQDSEPTRYIDKVETKELAKKTSSKKKINFQMPSLTTANLKVLGGTAAAFFVSALIIIFVMFKMSDNPLLSSAEDVDVPNFVGMTKEEIENAADENGYDFRFEFVEEYSSNVAAGQVIGQKPAYPKMVKANQKIIIRISVGEEILKMPSVAGLTKNDAEKELTSLGFTNISFVSIEDKTITENTVIKTDPVAGENVPAGQKITIYYATSQKIVDVTVPSVVGMDIQEARKLLAQHYLTIGEISAIESDLPVGTVILQTPEEGTKVTMNTRINLTVSSGRPEPPPPVSSDSSSVPSSTPSSSESSSSEESSSEVTSSST